MSRIQVYSCPDCKQDYTEYGAVTVGIRVECPDCGSEIA